MSTSIDSPDCDTKSGKDSRKDDSFLCYPVPGRFILLEIQKEGKKDWKGKKKKEINHQKEEKDRIKKQIKPPSTLS